MTEEYWTLEIYRLKKCAIIQGWEGEGAEGGEGAGAGGRGAGPIWGWPRQVPYRT